MNTFYHRIADNLFSDNMVHLLMFSLFFLIPLTSILSDDSSLNNFFSKDFYLITLFFLLEQSSLLLAKVWFVRVFFIGFSFFYFFYFFYFDSFLSCSLDILLVRSWWRYLLSSSWIFISIRSIVRCSTTVWLLGLSTTGMKLRLSLNIDFSSLNNLYSFFSSEWR